MTCFRCGISADRALLYDAISSEGVSKVCKRCAREVNIPIIKKPTEFKLKESRERSNVRDVLVRISGYKEESKKQPEVLERQETALNEIVKQNLPEIIKSSAIPTDEFVDNFHWIIMRYRRLRKLTQKELATEIREPEVAVKLSEQGIVSKQTPFLIEKLEKYLNVKLRKDSGDKLMGEVRKSAQEELYPVKKSVETLNEEFSKPKEDVDLSFDPIKTKEITIGDLRSLKSEKEIGQVEIKEEPEEEKREEKPLDEQNLSDKEIDDILFGRK